MDLHEAWDRVLKWYMTNVPADQIHFGSGATDEDIDAFEKRLGVCVSPEMRESYKIHNGVAWCGLLDLGQLLDLIGIEKEYLFFKSCCERLGNGENANRATFCRCKPGDGVKRILWSPLRLPLTDNQSGDHYMLDQDPDENGIKGQIIYYDHETGPESLEAPSFGAWVASMVGKLEKGKWYFDDEYERVMDRDKDYS